MLLNYLSYLEFDFYCLTCSAMLNYTLFLSAGFTRPNKRQKL